MVTHQARKELVSFEIATNPLYNPNWNHEIIGKELENIEKHGDRDFKILILTVPPRHGKQCASSTLVSTPDGFKKHGELKVGDSVFSPTGKPIRIKSIIPQEQLASMLVTMTDGSSVKVHPNHEWTVYDRKKNINNNLVTVETRNMREDVWIGERDTRGSRARWQLPEIRVIQFDAQETEVDPYTLGCWLGDGSKGKPCLTLHPDDVEDIISHVPYEVSSISKHKITGIWTVYFGGTRGVGGKLTKGLQKLEVYTNKHIPQSYLFNTEEIRRELLAGLVDTDGCVGKDKRVRFVNINKRLIEDTSLLIRSLGYRTTITSQKATLSSSGIQGKSRVYTVAFTPTDDRFYTHLQRKNNRILWGLKRRIAIVSITEIKGVRGECIEVDSEDGLYLVTDHFIPTHNSQQASIDFPAWYLGRNPTKEIITSSYSGDLAQDFGSKTREKVESEEFAAIFPGVRLKPDEKAKGKWRVEALKGKKWVPGGSYTSVGIGGPITGRGANIFLIDDPIKNREEAESEVIRNKIWNWFTSTAYTRLEPRGVMVIILTRWHQGDLAGLILEHPELSKRTKLISFPALALDKEEHREVGEALWPDRYNLSALEEIKNAIGPYDWSALYQGYPILSELQEFKPEWYKYIEEGQLEYMNTRKFLTIDTAMSKKETANHTGFCENFVNKENFWHFRAWRMRLGPEELVETLFALHLRNKYEKIGIEKTTYTVGLKPYIDSEQRKRNVFLPIVELGHHQVSKEIRIRGLIPRYSSGSIFHIKGRCNDLEEEQASFPMGSKDDVLDAAAYQDQLEIKPPKKYKSNSIPVRRGTGMRGT